MTDRVDTLLKVFVIVLAVINGYMAIECMYDALAFANHLTPAKLLMSACSTSVAVYALEVAFS